MLETTHNSIQQAMEQIRHGTQPAIKEGIRDAMQELDQTIREGTTRVDQAIAQLDLRMLHARRLNISHAWKTFIAGAVGSVAVIAVAIYASFQAHADIKRSDWIRQINTAIDAGQLSTCPEGGLCAKVDNKWTRLHGK